MISHRDGTSDTARAMRRVRLLTALIFAVLLAVGLTATALHALHEVDARRDAALRLAGASSGHLRQRLEAAISATYSLAAVVQQNGYAIDPASFDNFAANLLRYHPGAASLQLSPGGIVTHVVPLAGNKAAIGHNLLADPARNTEAFSAVRTRMLTLAGPFQLMQGGFGLVARLPIFHEHGKGAFWGFAAAVIKIDDLIAATGLDDLTQAGFQWALWREHPDTQAPLVFAGAAEPLAEDALTHAIPVANGTWFLSLRPVNGWVFDRWLEIAVEAVVSLLGAGAGAGLMGHLLRQPLALRREVERHTAELARAAQELRVAATAFESQEGMVVTDAATRILRVNTAFTEVTGYSAAEVVGKTPAVLASGQHDEAFYRRMWASLERDLHWQGEIFNRRKNGEVYPEWLSITAVPGPDGAIAHYVGAFTDITLRKQAEEQIRNLAFYDPLTQLANRRLLHDRLEQALAHSARSRLYGALLFLDLDNFKTLNDTKGHHQGDRLLVLAAQRLRHCVREGDTVARAGGDEFVVVLESLSEDVTAAANRTEDIAEKCREALAQPYRLAEGEAPYHLSASLGLTLFLGHEHSVEELLQRADVAMYESKDAGRNTIRMFDPGMQAALVARAGLEGDLREALPRDELRLYYQAQVDSERRIIGAEALLRWRHETRGLVSPADFIPLAEDTGLILPIGHWVMETACAQLRRWEDDPATRALQLAVNVSARQFRQPDFVERVCAILAHTGADPKRLKLELTERLLLDDIEDAIAKMAQLRRVGVRFSMDDFGTGYSSLSYLKRLPIDQLKIDQSFVRNVTIDTSDAAIVQAISSLARHLSLNVIAEGVETEEQLKVLGEHGCPNYQGYLFSRPVPLEEFEGLVRS